MAVALVTALAGAVAEAARGSDVAVFVEGDFEIPPLAYFDGRGFKPVHVAYVGEWDKAYCAPFQLSRRTRGARDPGGRGGAPGWACGGVATRPPGGGPAPGAGWRRLTSCLRFGGGFK